MVLIHSFLWLSNTHTHLFLLLPSIIPSIRVFSSESVLQEESEKVGLKLNIQKAKIMAAGPITSWQIDRETVETVSDFIFLGSKITADGDCSHEIKRWKKSYDQHRQHIKKQRHHFADKSPYSQSYVFSSESHVRLFATPWIVAYQASLSMGFPRQENWSGLPFPFPGDPPDPGIKPGSPAW